MPDTSATRGLSLAPFRALRYTAGSERLGALLCPPYDVIDDRARADLLAQDADNAVQLILPRPTDDDRPGAEYARVATTLDGWLASGVLAVDDTAALYVYEMSAAATSTEPGSVTRGLVGAVELRDAEDGVILPHENTMAGPVADRLALMDATDANLEPIYLVYDGGGAASAVVAGAGIDGVSTLLAEAETPDGVHHRLWAVTDPQVLEAVESDLNARSALIADGHHRYATYLQLRAQRQADIGAGAWDRGLALLVDSSAYGPQVHPIHRVIPGLSLTDALSAAGLSADQNEVDGIDAGLQALDQPPRAGAFAAVLTDGERYVVIGAPDASLVVDARSADEPTALMDLDVSVLHRVLIERVWGLADNESTVGYAHSIADALDAARAAHGVAVLLRPTPVAAVAAVAAAGARMPRKSTLFTPKPASGLLMRRFADQDS